MGAYFIDSLLIIGQNRRSINYLVPKHTRTIMYIEYLRIIYFLFSLPSLPTNVPVIDLYICLGQSKNLWEDLGNVKVLQLEPLVGT